MIRLGRTYKVHAEQWLLRGLEAATRCLVTISRAGLSPSVQLYDLYVGREEGKEDASG